MQRIIALDILRPATVAE